MSNVNHPSHYNEPGKKECIVEMQEMYGRFFILGFDLGNAYKYLYRAGLKDGNPVEQDIEKARWYEGHFIKTFESYNWFQRLFYRLAIKVLR